MESLENNGPNFLIECVKVSWRKHSTWKEVADLGFTVTMIELKHTSDFLYRSATRKCIGTEKTM